MRRILCAVDFSDASEDALRQADALARETDAELAICHVVADVVGVNPLFPQRQVPEAMAVPERERDARDALAALAQRAIGRGPGEAELFVELGSPYAEVLRRAEAWQADLVVAGSRGGSGLQRLLLGSVAAKIVRYAHSPVLVARPSAGAGAVIAATDLSDAAAPAIDMGVREAQRRKAELVVVHCLDLAPPSVLLGLGSPFGLAYTGPSTEILADVRAAARATIESALARHGAKGEIIISDGAPAATVVKLAEDRSAALVVVGTRGRTGLSRVALGSVAEKIVYAAPCSVLALRLHGS